MRPSAHQVAARAIELVTGQRIAYSALDCQAFVEKCINDCGGSLRAAGSNDMVRNHCAWLGTLENARAEGKLVPGVGLLIHEDSEAVLPAKYRGDGLGDFSHVGLYVGANALTDADRNGQSRRCDAAHSSASMGRVAGSTLANGWTHVMLFREVAYEVETDGLDLSAVAEGIVNDGGKAPSSDGKADMSDAGAVAPIEKAVYVIVNTGNQYGLKVRERPERGAITKYTATNGTRLRVLGERNGFYQVMYMGRARYVDKRFTVADERGGAA